MKKNWFGLVSVVLSFGMLCYFTLAAGGVRAVYTETRGMDIRWIFAAVACMLMYWALDGLVLHLFTRLRYQNHPLAASLKSAMTGLFYSALTPFAIGGQPMQVVEMVRYGINVGDAGSIITVKTILYQICMTLYAIVAVFAGFSIFVGMVPHFWLFITVGLLLNLVFIAVIFIVSINRHFTEKCIGGFINFLEKCRLLKRTSGIRNRIFEQVAMFHESAILLNRQRRIQLLAFCLTILQLSAFYLVPYCIYRSFHLSGAVPAAIVCAQAIVSMITAFIPLPGGSGAAEGSFHIFFAMFFTKLTLLPAIFIWRSITYYFCIMAGGLINFTSIVEQGLTVKE